MDEAIRGEFRHVKEGHDKIEKHLETQDRQMSDHFKRFGQHVLDDALLKAAIDVHLMEHKESHKQRWAIVVGIIVAAVSTVGILAVEIIKHFFMKG